MKKLISALLTVALSVTLMGCSAKEPITSASFEEQMTEAGYIIADCTEQYAEAAYIEKCYVALSDEEANYQIEWYEISDNDTAVQFFNTQKSIFEESAGNASATTSLNGTNSNKYTLSTDGTYKLLSRIDNTVIYVDCDSEYKDAVQETLKALGY